MVRALARRSSTDRVAFYRNRRPLHVDRGSSTHRAWMDRPIASRRARIVSRLRLMSQTAARVTPYSRAICDWVASLLSRRWMIVSRSTSLKYRRWGTAAATTTTDCGSGGGEGEGGATGAASCGSSSPIHSAPSCASCCEGLPVVLVALVLVMPLRGRSLWSVEPTSDHCMYRGGFVNASIEAPRRFSSGVFIFFESRQEQAKIVSHFVAWGEQIQDGTR